jgi:mono/diheme cytochrome c family protein
MKLLYWVGGLVLVILILCVVFIRGGAYNVAADVPHWAFTHSVMEKLRTASVERRSAHIEVPLLGDAALVSSGAGNYDAMCAGCHLKPGVEATEMSRGLYPAPPNFTTRPPEDPAAAFWVIKHGIKMSGMPAWGQSMGDEYIWGLVAFLKKLPGMSPDRYRELVDASGGHQHGGLESGMEAEASGHAHETAGGPQSHEHDDSPADDDHSKAPPHQH